MENKKIEKIVIFTMDSLYSTIIVDYLSQRLKDRIKLICLSDRYSGEHGSFFDQAKQIWRRSGFKFVNYLSVIFIYYKILIPIFNLINTIFSPDKKINSIKIVSNRHHIKLLKVSDINHEEVEKIIREIEPDLIVSAFFDQLIKENIFVIPKFKTINAHPALLPSYRGPFPIFWALYAGERDLGVTIHYVDKKYDTGDIIFQKIVNVKNYKTVLGVEHVIYKEMASMILETINKIEFGNLMEKPQQRGSYQSFPTRHEIKEASSHNLKLFNISEFIKIFIK